MLLKKIYDIFRFYITSDKITKNILVTFINNLTIFFEKTFNNIFIKC